MSKNAAEEIFEKIAHDCYAPNLEYISNLTREYNVVINIEWTKEGIELWVRPNEE